jgi:hypothetical protein
LPGLTASSIYARQFNAFIVNDGSLRVLEVEEILWHAGSTIDGKGRSVVPAPTAAIPGKLK